MVPRANQQHAHNRAEHARAGADTRRSLLLLLLLFHLFQSHFRRQSTSVRHDSLMLDLARAISDIRSLSLLARLTPHCSDLVLRQAKAIPRFSRERHGSNNPPSTRRRKGLLSRNADTPSLCDKALRLALHQSKARRFQNIVGPRAFSAIRIMYLLIGLYRRFSACAATILSPLFPESTKRFKFNNIFSFPL